MIKFPNSAGLEFGLRNGGYLDIALTIYANPMPLEIFEEASQIYRDGRIQGFAIRSSVDCLIAVVALRFDLVIWHHDRDFDLIAKFRPLRVTRAI
jgi:predicted nucleic acid-binding protein